VEHAGWLASSPCLLRSLHPSGLVLFLPRAHSSVATLLRLRHSSGAGRCIPSCARSVVPRMCQPIRKLKSRGEAGGRAAVGRRFPAPSPSISGLSLFLCPFAPISSRRFLLAVQIGGRLAGVAEPRPPALPSPPPLSMRLCAAPEVARLMLGVHVRADQRATVSTSDDVPHDQRIIGPCWLTAAPTH
jgi:hypothetical protein